MTETWKVVYIPSIQNNGMRGVALIEAVSRSEAMFAFQRQYSGQYHTVETCTKLI